MFSHLTKLSKESLEFGLHRMNARVYFASILGVVLAFVVFYLAPMSLMTTLQFKIFFSVIVATSCGSLAITKFGKKLFALPNGIRLWRLVFLGHAWAYSLAWGFACQFMIESLHMNAYSLSVTTTALAACTVGVTTLAFDIFACAVFILSVLTPIIYTSLFQVADGQGLAASSVLSMIFFLYLAYMIHRSEVDVLIFRDQLRAQSEQIKRSNELFQSTIDNIDQVFLTLDLKGVCFGNQSLRATKILKLEPVGKNIAEILRVKDPEGTLQWFEMLTEGVIPFETLRPLGPTVWVDEENRLTYRIRYFPMRAAGELQSVIMMLSDVTRNLRTERAAEEADARAQFVLAVSANPVTFSKSLSEITDFLNGLAESKSQDLEAIRQELHTAKGTAGMFGMSWLAREINEIEAQAKAFPDFTNEASQYLALVAADLLERLAKWLVTEAPTLTRLRVFAPEEISFGVAYAKVVREALSPAQGEVFDSAMRLLQGQSLAQMLQAYDLHVQKVANKLKKKLRFDVLPGEHPPRLLDETYLPVVRSIIHLLNNAVDHGIETTMEREQLRKPALGSLRITFAQERGCLVIRCEDDGRGIDVPRLRSLAIERGQNFSAKSDFEVAQTIFLPNISTRETVTEISGQGIGLNALYDEVTRVGGKLQVLMNAAGGSTFEIELPVTQQTVWFEKTPINPNKVRLVS